MAGVEININPEGPIAKEAAGFARSLIEANIDNDTEFFNLVWQQMPLPKAFQPSPGETQTEVEHQVRFQASLIASLATIAALAILATNGGEEADYEADREGALRFLRQLADHDITF